MRSPLTLSEIVTAPSRWRSAHGDRDVKAARTRHRVSKTFARCRASQALPADPPWGSSSSPNSDDASDSTAGVMSTSISLPAAFASNGRSPTAKKPRRMSANCPPLTPPALQGRQSRNRHADARTHRKKCVECVARRRQLDGDQQILRRKLCLIDPGEECVRGNPPLAAGAAGHDGRAERQHAGRQFGRWVGLRKAAADGAAVADRGMGDMGDGRRQQRGTAITMSGFQEIDMAGQRANGENVLPFTTIPRNSANSPISTISSGRNQAQIHRRHQALAARQDPGLLAMCGQQFQRMCNAGCTCISESRGLHSGVTFPGPAYLLFTGLDGCDLQRSSCCCVIISTFGLVLIQQSDALSCRQEGRLRGRAEP